MIRPSWIWKRSLFRKTALVFVVVAMLPAAIISLRSENVVGDHLDQMVDNGTISRAEAQAQIGEIRQHMLIFSLYGAALALVMGYFFADSLVRPIRSLQLGARRIGVGDLDARIETDTDNELEELAANINQMAASLKSRDAQLRLHSRNLTILYDLVHEISEAHELDELLTQVLEKTMNVTGTAGGCVFIIDDQGSLVPTVTKGIDSHKQSAAIFDQAAQAATSTGEPAVVTGSVESGPYDTIACVAIKYENILQGAICVAGKELDFSSATMRLLTAIGSEVAIAVENRRLLEKLAQQNNELSQATAEIAGLIRCAEKDESFGIRYHNDSLGKCWEIKNCIQHECPSFMSEDLRCWQVSGTHCGGEVQGVFAQKLGRCEKCEVYQQACSDRITTMGETFNNMMASLELRVSEQEKLQQQLFNSSKLAAIGELAAEVAHEINNPMTGILANAMLLKNNQPDRETVLEKVGIIEQEALRARDIVRNLLDFAHQDRNFQPKPVAIPQLAEHSLALLENQARNASIEIETCFKQELLLAVVDAGHIKQVFLNIFTNAIHAMPEGGKLTVSIADKSDLGKPRWVEVTITDTGIGMDRAKKARIFDPFFTTKQTGKGTGLGLSVTQRIISEHGGEIDVDSTPGAGSTFTVRLPAGNQASSREVA